MGLLSTTSSPKPAAWRLGGIRALDDAAEVFTRRIETSSGILALRGWGVRCPTTAGIRVRTRYEVDGTASTGVFAGARGRGTVTLDARRAGHLTISGTLKLRRS